MAAPTIQTILKPTRARGLDTSGNNNHAQIYSGRALEFDGVTDYLDTNMTSANAYGNNTNFTVTAWYKCNGNESNYHTIVGNGSGWSAGVWLVVKDNDIRFNVNKSIGGDYALHHDVFKTTDDSIHSDTWYRIVATYDSVSGAKIYLNGIEALNSDGMGEPLGDAYHTGNVTIGAVNHDISTPQYLANASICDVQIWNSTWTAADAEYDYLNPEQLALNRGGTSLTNSNLKLWYPMNEGHRGNQSYVLDASNTGFNEAELLTNNSFDDGTTGWTLANPGDASVSASGGQLTLSIDAIDGSSGDRNAYIRQTALVIGKRYRVTIDIAQDNTGIGIRAEAMGGTGYGTAESVGVTTFDITAVASTDIVFRMLNIGSPSETGSIVVNSVSVQGINNKNNATTAFYGDEQITDAKNRTGFASHDWVHYNSASGNINVSSSKLFITCNSSAGAGDNQGAQLAIAKVDAEGSSHPIVAGRTYRMQADLDFTTIADSDLVVKFALGNASEVITASDGSPSGGTIDATEQTYYADITTKDATGNLRINCTAATNDSGSDNIFSVDNVSVKEVGTAMGWTDADQQLDIPQTALQSYSQIPYNFTKGGTSSTSHFYTCDASVGTVVNNSFTLSMWLFSHDEDSGTQFLFSVNDRDAGYNTEESFAVKWLTNGNIQFSYNINSGGDTHSTTGQIFDSNDLGKWLHFAVSHNYSNDTTSVYKNGELITTKDHSTTMDLNIGGGTTQVDVHWGDASAFKGSNLKGAMNEMSVWNTNLSTSQIGEIYNNGSPLDCTTHSASSNLTNYWRNNGLAVWSDLAGSNNLTPTNFTETMLITAGADSSRDSQGFLMNRQRLTNCVNSLNDSAASVSGNYEGQVVLHSDTINITSDYTLCGWFKFEDLDYSYNFFNKKGDWNNLGYGMYRHTNGNMYMEYANDSGYKQLDRPFTPTLGVWYFVFSTHTDGGNDVRGYAATTDTSFTSSSSSGALTSVGTNDLELTIGVGTSGDDDNSHIQFSGQIDDVQVYNGKALSTDELMRNFKAGKRSHR